MEIQRGGMRWISFSRGGPGLLRFCCAGAAILWGKSEGRGGWHDDPVGRQRQAGAGQGGPAAVKAAVGHCGRAAQQRGGRGKVRHAPRCGRCVCSGKTGGDDRPGAGPADSPALSHGGVPCSPAGGGHPLWRGVHPGLDVVFKRHKRICFPPGGEYNGRYTGK